MWSRGRWIEAARSTLLDRLWATQAAAIEEAAALCADGDRRRRAGPPLRHRAQPASRSRRCSPATARIPGFHPIVELSTTFHTQVVGANGQRQAMFIERVEGLAEVILSNFQLGPPDVMIVFSASGLSANPIEMAMGARGAGCR